MWADGRDVAVKVQYPGAGDALLSDLTQIGRMSRLVGLLVPGLDVKPLVAELKARVAEELDYTARGGQPGDVRRRPSPATRTSWSRGSSRAATGCWSASGSTGLPLSRRSSRPAAREQRDRAGLLLARFLFSGPPRAGHAARRPAPRQLPAARRRPARRCSTTAPSTGCRTGCRPRSARCSSWRSPATPTGSSTGCAEEGFVRPGISLDAQALLGYLAPILEPARAETFRFSRAWLRSQAVRVGDPRSPAYSTGLQLNLPPDYLLIHRVTTGAIGVLCQLEAEGPWRAELRTLAARLRPRPAGAPTCSAPRGSNAPGREARRARRQHRAKTATPTRAPRPALVSGLGSPPLQSRRPSIARTFSRLHRSQ